MFVSIWYSKKKRKGNIYHDCSCLSAVFLVCLVITVYLEWKCRRLRNLQLLTYTGKDPDVFQRELIKGLRGG